MDLKVRETDLRTTRCSRIAATEIAVPQARIMKTVPHLHYRTAVVFIHFLVLNTSRYCRLCLYHSRSIKERYIPPLQQQERPNTRQRQTTLRCSTHLVVPPHKALGELETKALVRLHSSFTQGT